MTGDRTGIARKNRALADHVSEAVVEFDREFRHVYMNAAAESRTGFSRESYLGKTPAEMGFPEESVRAWDRALNAVFETGRPMALEYDHPIGAGKVRFHAQLFAENWTERPIASVFAILSKAPEKTGSATIADQGEEHFQRALMDAPIPIMVHAQDGEILLVNSAWMRKSGYDREELVRIPDWSSCGFVDAEARDLLFGPTLYALDEPIRQGEVTVRYKSGEEGIWGFYAAPLGTLLDRRRMVVTLAVDATARRAAEKTLRQSEEMFRLVVQHAPDIFIIYDREATIRFINRTLPEYTVEGVLGTSTFSYVVPEDEARFKRAFEGVLAERKPCSIEVTETMGSHWLVRLVPLAEGDDVRAILSIGTDITTLRQAEAERQTLHARMLHAQKLESLGILATGIAHDFNNLLVGVMGNVDLALSELAADSPYRVYLDEIDHASQRAAELCQKMLRYAGKGRLFTEPVDINESVREVGRLLEATVCKKAVLRYTLDSNLPLIVGDSIQIRQMLVSLITNGAEAIGDRSGAISVSTTLIDWSGGTIPRNAVDDPLAEGRYVSLEVTDTGEGMDEETLRRAFDPFYSTKLKGRGLGLAAVLGIIRAHRGAVTVKSTVGEGSTFCVLLPVSAPALAPA